jgi:hypothetical protein
MIGFMSLPVHPLAGQRVGYARISGASQNLDGQTDALTAAGCQKTWSENKTSAGHVFRAGGGLCRRLSGASRREACGVSWGRG